MSERRGIRLAKADDEDFATTREFLQCCDNLFENRWACCSDEQWQDWNDEDEDKKEILQLRRQLALYEDCDEDEIDNRILLFEFIKQKYRTCECNWRRVVMAADVLIKNACDPMQDTVEWHPFIERILDDAILGE